MANKDATWLSVHSFLSYHFFYCQANVALIKLKVIIYVILCSNTGDYYFVTYLKKMIK